MYCALSVGLHAWPILASIVSVLRAVQMQAKSAGLHLLFARFSKRMVCWCFVIRYDTVGMEEETKTYRTFGETFNSRDNVLGRVG
jgi:hypothetical protein